MRSGFCKALLDKISHLLSFDQRLIVSFLDFLEVVLDLFNPLLPLSILHRHLFDAVLFEPVHHGLYILVESLRVEHLLKHGELVLHANRERLIRMLHVVERFLQVFAPVLVNYDTVFHLHKATGELLKHTDLGIHKFKGVLDFNDRFFQGSHVAYHVFVGIFNYVHCGEKRDHQGVDDASDLVFKTEPIILLLSVSRWTVSFNLTVQVT